MYAYKSIVLYIKRVWYSYYTILFNINRRKIRSMARIFHVAPYRSKHSPVSHQSSRPQRDYHITRCTRGSGGVELNCLKNPSRDLSGKILGKCSIFVYETLRRRFLGETDDLRVFMAFINRRQTNTNSASAHGPVENVIFHMFANIFKEDYLNLCRDSCETNVNETF